MSAPAHSHRQQWERTFDNLPVSDVENYAEEETDDNEKNQSDEEILAETIARLERKRAEEERLAVVRRNHAIACLNMPLRRPKAFGFKVNE
jgi:hypothetical protein